MKSHLIQAAALAVCVIAIGCTPPPAAGGDPGRRDPVCPTATVPPTASPPPPPAQVAQCKFANYSNAIATAGTCWIRNPSNNDVTLRIVDRNNEPSENAACDRDAGQKFVVRLAPGPGALVQFDVPTGKVACVERGRQLDAACGTTPCVP